MVSFRAIVKEQTLARFGSEKFAVTNIIPISTVQIRNAHQKQAHIAKASHILKYQWAIGQVLTRSTDSNGCKLREKGRKNDMQQVTLAAMHE